jgi:hypothetical protein
MAWWMWSGLIGLDSVHVLYLDVRQLDWCKEQTTLLTTSCPACFKLQLPEVLVAILHCELAIPCSPSTLSSPDIGSLAFVSVFYMPLARTQSIRSFDCDMPIVSSCNPPSLHSSDSLQTKAPCAKAQLSSLRRHEIAVNDLGDSASMNVAVVSTIPTDSTSLSKLLFLQSLTPSPLSSALSRLLSTPLQSPTLSQSLLTPSQLLSTPSQLLSTPSQLLLTPSQLSSTPSQLSSTPSQLLLTPSQLSSTPSQLSSTKPSSIPPANLWAINEPRVKVQAQYIAPTPRKSSPLAPAQRYITCRPVFPPMPMPLEPRLYYKTLMSCWKRSPGGRKYLGIMKLKRKQYLGIL